MAVLQVEAICTMIGASRTHPIQRSSHLFSKASVYPLLYSMYKAAGLRSRTTELLSKPVQARWAVARRAIPIRTCCPYVDVATGSLGQGLLYRHRHGPQAANTDKLPYRVWVVLGDSEVAEGSIWETSTRSAALQTRQHGGHPRHESSRPSAAHGPWLEMARPSRRAPKRSAGTPSKSTGTTSTAIDKPPTPRSRANGPSHGPRRQDTRRVPGLSLI